MPSARAREIKDKIEKMKEMKSNEKKRTHAKQTTNASRATAIKPCTMFYFFHFQCSVVATTSSLHLVWLLASQLACYFLCLRIFFFCKINLVRCGDSSVISFTFTVTFVSSSQHSFVFHFYFSGWFAFLLNTYT